jgi:hypothetical protein
MKATLSRVLTLLTLLAAAGLSCSSDETTAPDEQPIPGINISAAVMTIAGGGAYAPGMLLSLGATITNTTNAAVTLSTPAGCAVRVRLYQLSGAKRVYDQTTFPCDAAVTVPLNLAAGESKTIPSQTTFPHNLESDSIPPATYRATAVVRITGQAPIELEAGSYRLPNCVSGITLSCAYVGPPADIDPRRKQ